MRIIRRSSPMPSARQRFWRSGPISCPKVATVIVPDYQLSLAIGKEGQNARLAAKITGWKIDIKSESQVGLVSMPRFEIDF